MIQCPGNHCICDFKIPLCQRHLSLSKILPGVQDMMRKEAELYQVDSGGIDEPCPLDNPNHCDGPCVGVPKAQGGTHQGSGSSSLQGSAPKQFQRHKLHPCSLDLHVSRCSQPSLYI